MYFNKDLNIKKQSLVTVIIFFTTILFFEKLYMPSNMASGSYNHIVSLLLTIVLFIITIITTDKIRTRSTILFFLSVFLILLHFIIFGGHTKELIRYSSILLIIYFGIQSKPPNMLLVSRWIILSGAIFTFSFDSLNSRVTGFLNSSPTLFSFVLLIAVSVLLFDKKKKFDYILILLSVYLIYQTESRTTLVACLILIVVSLAPYLKTRIAKVIVSAIFLFFVYITYSFVDVNSPFSRMNSADSTNTRIQILSTAYNHMVEKPASFLIGNGAGESYHLYYQYAGRFIPLHFDPMVVFYDYGAIGIMFMILLTLSFIGKNKLALFLLIVGASHNLIYFPIGIFLLVLSIRYLEERRGNSKTSSFLFSIIR